MATGQHIAQARASAEGPDASSTPARPLPYRARAESFAGCIGGPRRAAERTELAARAV
jgi:hypothetical protein